MSLINFALDPYHGYAILASAAISLQCAFSSIAVSGLRKKYNVPYPDSGDGRHADKLTDEQWTEFHNALRAHRNYTEQIGMVQALIFSSAILHPKLSTILGAVYLVGRQFYYWGYVSKGPSGRFVGAILLDLALVGWLGTSIYSGLKIAGLV